MFDSSVYQRRKHTPWARMSFLAFAHEMLWNEPEDDKPVEVKLTISYRHDVDSRHWYELTWIGCDGKIHAVSSKEFDLCLFRAAEVELRNKGNRIDTEGR